MSPESRRRSASSWLLASGVALALATALGSTLLIYRVTEVSLLLAILAGRTLLIGGALAGSLVVFARAVVRNPRMPERGKNAITVAFTVFAAFLLLEGVFTFVPRSHGNGDTLGARVWEAYFWRPLNAFGYRDAEVPREEPQAYKIVLVGDSFAAGHGIDNVKDRYGDRLARALGGGYRVYNLGVSGHDTTQEMQELLRFPLRPDFVVLQYFGNDIETRCRAAKPWTGFKPYRGLSAPTRVAIESSFLLNYVYWASPTGGYDDMNLRYADWLVACFRDPAILQRHLSDLERFVEYARTRDVALLVLVFPFMEENVGSVNDYAGLVESFFAARGVPVISVLPLARTLPPKERVVNSSDGHAGPRVQALVAEALRPQVERAAAKRAPPSAR